MTTSILRSVSLVLSLATGLGAPLVGGCDKGPATATTAPAAGSTAIPGKLYGAALTGAPATPIASILAAPTAFAGKPVRVEGLVTDVCTMRGCWFELAGDKPGETLRFKVQDGTMTFPLEAKGQHAVAEGVIAVNTLSLADTKAYAEEQAKEAGLPFDPATVTAPRTIVRLDGTGAVLRDRK